MTTGFARAGELDVALTKQWERGRRAKLQSDLAAWQEQQAANRRRHEQELAAWRLRHAERCREVEARMPAWTQARDAEGQQLRELTARGIRLGPVPLLAVLVILVVIGVPAWVYLLAAGVVLTPTAGPALLSWQRLLALQRGQPSADRADDPQPRPPPPEREPTLDEGERPSVVEAWWDAVSDDGDVSRTEHKHGDQGEDAFWELLDERLPDEYVAVRNLLVRRSLDVDVIVVGPSGIWLLEVKYLSGSISCVDGEWTKVRTYFGPGGVEQSKQTEIGSLDRQWLREQDAVETTLRRRLDDPGRLLETIGGGIVFSHDDCDWDDVDGSCQAELGSMDDWVQEVTEGPECLTAVDAQRAIEALLKFAHKLDDDLRSRASSSVGLAQKLYDQHMADVRRRFGQAG